LTRRAYVRGAAGIFIMAAAFVAGWMSTPPALTDGAGLAHAADQPKPNACGCYRDTTGACFCGKKGACVCPGECEPKGCEEKRAKQLEKEIAAETKKAEAAGRAANAGKSKAAHADDEGESKAADVKAKGKEKAVHLTAGQKKELAKLLEAYVAEHPEGKSQTAEEIRKSIAR
jgi:hypothetical protein